MNRLLARVEKLEPPKGIAGVRLMIEKMSNEELSKAIGLGLRRLVDELNLDVSGLSREETYAFLAEELRAQCKGCTTSRSLAYLLDSEAKQGQKEMTPR